MLTQSQIDQLSDLMAALETRLRGEVRSGLRTRLEHSPEEDAGSADRAGQAVADLEDGVAIGSLTRDVAELEAIVRARERLAAGTYGECTECRLPIDFTRLVALPAAERCLACQDRVERGSGSGPVPSL